MISNNQIPETSSAILKRESDYWEGQFDFDYMTENSIKRIIRSLPPPSGDALELCAGSGMFTKHIHSHYQSYCCLNLSASLLKTLKTRFPNIQTYHGDAQEPPFNESSFDQILIFAGLHHLPDRRKTLGRVSQLLKKSGYFICVEPNDLCWYRKPISYMKSHLKLYTEDEIFLNPHTVTQECQKAGLNVERVVFQTPAIKPIHPSLLNRFLARLMDGAGHVSKGPKWQSWFILIARKND